MEKENIIENETKGEVEEVEAVTEETKEEITEVVENNEAQSLTDEEASDKDSVGRTILANALDQLVLVACSSLLVVLSDLILRLFGYMFIRGNGALIFAGGIIYFVINCFYVPAMEKTKLRSTIAKKILSI